MIIWEVLHIFLSCTFMPQERDETDNFQKQSMSLQETSSLFGHLLGCSTTSKVWIIYSHNFVALLIISKHLASIGCFKPS